jgi:hypothetical protein
MHEHSVQFFQPLAVHQVESTHDSIGEIDSPYRFDGSAETPTVRKVVEHTALILEADLADTIRSHRDSIGPRRRGRRHRLYQHAVASRTPLVLVISGVMGSLLLLVALSAPL